MSFSVSLRCTNLHPLLLSILLSAKESDIGSTKNIAMSHQKTMLQWMERLIPSSEILDRFPLRLVLFPSFDRNVGLKPPIFHLTLNKRNCN